MYRKLIAVAIVLAALTPAAAAATPKPRFNLTSSTLVRLAIGDELVPCKYGGQVLAVRELATGLRLVREPRPPRYIRRADATLDAVRDWELDRRAVFDRGGVRYFAHVRGAELSNNAPAAIGVRLSCDPGR